MTRKTLNSRHALESCTFQLHSWKPFHLQTVTKTLDSSSTDLHPLRKPYSLTTANAAFHSKKPCLSDRTTTPTTVEIPDMSKLTLFEEEKPTQPLFSLRRKDNFPWVARKRRRRGSRSVSGRSSDRSGTRRCCASANYATCSDFPMAAGTDSSGELFVNGDGNWASDVSEVKNINRRGDGKDIGNGVVERESSWQGGVFDAVGNESGYGSEPGYRGDAEFGYGDEFDEEEDDGRVLFWGDRFGDTEYMEIVGENTFSEQKTHHRCRRKKHEWRTVAPLR